MFRNDNCKYLHVVDIIYKVTDNQEVEIENDMIVRNKKNSCEPKEKNTDTIIEDDIGVNESNGNVGKEA